MNIGNGEKMVPSCSDSFRNVRSARRNPQRQAAGVTFRDSPEQIKRMAPKSLAALTYGYYSFMLPVKSTSPAAETKA
jgi:hypothetical protein